VDEAVLAVGGHRAPGGGAGVDDEVGAGIERVDGAVGGAGTAAKVGGAISGRGHHRGRRRGSRDGGETGERDDGRGGEGGETRYDHCGVPLDGRGGTSP